MIFLLLKVGGLDHLPEHVLNDWALEPSQVWQAGETSPAGQPYEDCGFNITLPDHESWDEALPALTDFMDAREEMFHELIALGAAMELHVGLSIPAGENFAPPLEFPHAFLADLVTREITLSVIAFSDAQLQATA